MALTYPSGRDIMIGDRVWIDEGAAVAYVDSIVRDLEDQREWIYFDLLPSGSSYSVWSAFPMHHARIKASIRSLQRNLPKSKRPWLR